MKKFKSKAIFSIFILVLIGIFFMSYNFLTKNKINKNLKVDNSNIKAEAPPRIDEPIEIGSNESVVKNAIINLPRPDKYIGFETQPDTATTGDKTVTLVAVWADNSVHKYQVPYKVFSVNWIKPKIEADIKTQTVTEGQNITPIHWTAENINSTNDEANYVMNKVNPILANYILNPNGLTYTGFTAPGGQGTLEGQINIHWRNNAEEQRIIELNNYTVFEHENDFTESKSTLIVNRDTDNDGTIDSEDDDDDDDGYSDQQEILYGSNPKDTKSKPSQAALYKINVLQKKMLKYYVGDTPNILDAITSDKTLNNANKIKQITIKQDITTAEKGEKIGKVEIEFDDCSTMEVEVIAKVFDKEIVAPELNVNLDSQALTEGSLIQDIIFSRESVDTTGSEFTDKKIDDITSQKLTVRSDVLPVHPNETVNEKTVAKDYSSPVNAKDLDNFDRSHGYTKSQCGNNEVANFTVEAEIVLFIEIQMQIIFQISMMMMTMVME